MGTLKNESEKAKNEWHRLKNQWNITSQDWDDDVKNRFEKEFWQEFEYLVPNFLKTLGKTSDSIIKACRDLKIRF